MSNDIRRIIEETIIDLIHKERFYAELITRMDRYIDPKLPAIAGINIKDKINLYINPEMFSQLDRQTRMGVLIHECQHILHDHIPRSKLVAPEVYEKKDNKDDIDRITDNIINSGKHRVINMSMDCAINSLNSHIGKSAKLKNVDGEEREYKFCFPEVFKLPEKQTFEWYLKKLKEKKENKNNEGRGESEGQDGESDDGLYQDNHSYWVDSDEDIEKIREKVRNAVNESAKSAKNVGSISSDLELQIQKLNNKTRDWKNDLKRFVARSTEYYIDTSRKKRNRRYGIQYPGVVKIEKLHLGIPIDTSGSVSDEALTQFMAEIGKLAKYVKITVIEADSEIKDVYEFDPRKTYKIKGRGGTAYNPAIQHCEEKLDVDGIVYFGDGDCFDEIVKKPKVPIMWALVGNSPAPASFGTVTRIKIKQKDEN